MEEVNGDIELLKSMITYKDGCVTQILSAYLDRIHEVHACYLLKRLMGSSKKVRIKDPRMLYLVLLAGTDQISYAIEGLGLSTKSGKFFKSVCCLDNAEQIEGNQENSLLITDRDRKLLTARTIAYMNLSR